MSIDPEHYDDESEGEFPRTSTLGLPEDLTETKETPAVTMAELIAEEGFSSW